MNNRDKFISSPYLQVQERILGHLFGKDEKLVMFDIGACEGESSVRYGRLFPNAEIYTFEPLATNFEYIKNNIKLYNSLNIYPFQLCLSDKVGETVFYVSEGKPENVSDEDWDYGNKSSSLLPPEKTTAIIDWLQFKKEIKVSTTTLKLFCETHQLSAIDFIHMDVQGAELLVLEGASDFLENINCIWLEVAKVELYKGQALKKDIEFFMKSNDFIKVADTVYTYDGDQFWIKSDFVKKRQIKRIIILLQIQSFIRKTYKSFRRNFLNKLIGK